jgi:hypothetical protein
MGYLGRSLFGVSCNSVVPARSADGEISVHTGLGANTALADDEVYDVPAVLVLNVFPQSDSHCEMVRLELVWQKSELMTSVLLTTVDGTTHRYCDGSARSSLKPQESTLVPATVQFKSCRKRGVRQVEDDATVGMRQRMRQRMQLRIDHLSAFGNMASFP